MNDMRFTIDVEAEIAKITQRQSLNAVHYLVQLVRKALQASPTSILIQTKKRSLHFEHDGDTLTPQEMALIQTIMTPCSDNHAQRQEALQTLENQFDITLLSLFSRFQQIRLCSANHHYFVQNEAMITEPGETPPKGFSLEIISKDRVDKEESSEVEFFCAGASVPIILNGKQINKPITLPPMLVTREFQIEKKEYKGSGVIGIPPEGEHNELWFYKHGVRAAMKQFRPQHEEHFHGWWNLESPIHEQNFEFTLRTGEFQMNHQAQTMYNRLVIEFAKLPGETRTRVKKLMYRWSVAEWFAELSHLPLFHSSLGEWTLSMKSLINLNKRFYAIPYATHGSPDVPPHIPLLDLDEIHFLTSQLRLSLRLVQTSTNAVADTKAVGSDQPIPTAGLSESAKAFLKRLDLADPLFKHAFSDGKLFQGTDQEGQAWMYLPHDHALIRQALAGVALEKEALLLWKYRNLERLKSRA